MPKQYRTQTMAQFKYTLADIPIENGTSIEMHRVFRGLISAVIALEDGLKWPNPTPKVYLQYDTDILDAVLWLNKRSLLIGDGIQPIYHYYEACRCLKLIILDLAFTRGWEFTATIDDGEKRFTIPLGLLQDRNFHLDPCGSYGFYSANDEIDFNNIEVIRHDSLFVEGKLVERPQLLTKKIFIRLLESDRSIENITSVFVGAQPSFAHSFTIVIDRPAHKIYQKYLPLHLPQGKAGAPTNIAQTREFFLRVCTPVSYKLVLSKVYVAIRGEYEKLGFQTIPSNETIRDHLLTCRYYLKNQNWNYELIQLDADNL